MLGFTPGSLPGPLAESGPTSWPELLVRHHDPESGLTAIVAVATTSLGPALGGTRFYPYPDAARAEADVVELATAMARKNAVAGLPHGGGKAVIWGDPTRDKSPELLRAYGRLVQSLSGRYITACDVGTTPADMDVVAEVCDYVTGRTPENGGVGDSGILTALGVHAGMRAAAQQVWGAPTLAGRTVGIAGVGKVGRRLAALLHADGAHLVVTDISSRALAALHADIPDAVIVASAADSMADARLDVVAPCALGHAVTTHVADALAARIVCGGANNQLAEPVVGELLASRAIVYVPDYVVNAGGVIAVAGELSGASAEETRGRVEAIFDTTAGILAEAAATATRPEVAADAIAERRLAERRLATRPPDGWAQRPADESSSASSA